MILFQRPCEEQLAIGGAGGARIVTGLVQGLINYALYHDSFRESLEKGRIHHQLEPDVLELEGIKLVTDTLFAI